MKLVEKRSSKRTHYSWRKICGANAEFDVFEKLQLGLGAEHVETKKVSSLMIMNPLFFPLHICSCCEKMLLSRDMVINYSFLPFKRCHFLPLLFLDCTQEILFFSSMYYSMFYKTMSFFLLRFCENQRMRIKLELTKSYFPSFDY